MALIQLGVVWEGGRGVVPPGWDALIAIAMPWLAGHVTFGPVTLCSAGSATLFAVAWGEAWHATSRRGRALTMISQIVAMASLAVLRRPLAAGTLFMLLVPQLALLPWTRASYPAEWFVRHTRPWLMVAMVVTAFALAF
jgi:hypothetical protein